MRHAFLCLTVLLAIPFLSSVCSASDRGPFGALRGSVVSWDSCFNHPQFACAQVVTPVGEAQLRILALDGRPARRVRSADNGGFRVRLPAGAYRLQLISPADYEGAGLAIRRGQRARVRPGKTTNLKIVLAVIK